MTKQELDGIVERYLWHAERVKDMLARGQEETLKRIFIKTAVYSGSTGQEALEMWKMIMNRLKEEAK